MLWERLRLQAVSEPVRAYAVSARDEAPRQPGIGDFSCRPSDDSELQQPLGGRIQSSTYAPHSFT